ncbi:MAG TPA: LysR substrate-binding domain-containing protein [Alphaproteobacteria bacterium]|jgi:LysR family pca operon transcriptional activator|nr:LysR substrate-binding domain-containing protein [Alphaproteobacteria bacterium]
MKRFLEHRLKLRMLRAMDMIEKHNSLLHAAHALGVTQPALTRTLKAAEEVLGGRLFERHARGVRPTAFGNVACAAARRVLLEVERLDHHLDQFLAGEASVVSVGATPPAAIGILPNIYETLRHTAPDIRISLTQGRTEDLLPLLAAGEIEMIVGRLPPLEDATEFVREILYDEPLSVLAGAGHPIFSQETVDREILRRYACILPTMSRHVEREIDAVAARLSLTIALRSIPQPFLRELLHESDHVTISPHFTMAGDLRRGTIRRVDFDLPSPPRPAGLLIRLEDSMRPSTRRVYSVMLDYFRTLRS